MNYVTPTKTYAKGINFSDILFWELFIIVIGIGLVAAVYTSIGLSSHWYQTLSLPWWSPPEWLFTLMWIISFCLIGLTGYAGVRADNPRYIFSGLFAVGLIVNVMFAFWFFWYQNIVVGYSLLVLLTVVVLIQIIYLSTLKNRPGRISGGCLTLFLLWLIYLISIYSVLL